MIAPKGPLKVAQEPVPHSLLRTRQCRTDQSIVKPKKLETGIRTTSAGIPYTLLLRIQAIGFPTFGLLL